MTDPTIHGDPEMVRTTAGGTAGDLADHEAGPVDGSMASLIRDRLTAVLAPEHLEVLDESAAHAGHAGHSGHGESHFRVRVVSAAFAGASRVARHRQVNAALAEAFSGGVHALAIEAAAPGEAPPWIRRRG